MYVSRSTRRLTDGALVCGVSSYWRIYSGLHTFAQILAGAVGGSTVGLAWEHLSHQLLNQRLGELLAGYPNSQVPLPYIASVMVVGALTVGSVERKIGKLVRALRRSGSQGHSE